MIPAYRGVLRQHGRGLGSIFKAVMKTAIPIVKPLVKTGIRNLKSQGLKHGKGAIRDIVVSGKKPKDVILSRGKQTLKSVGKSSVRSLGKTLLKATQPIKVTPHKTPRQSKTRRRRRKITFKALSGPKHSKRPLDIFD